ncbi:MAG: hypothetical protein AUJ85_08195 [Elusimicrobia bacterium CG1_02_37_114]|nr:MAG: hypothetical protein AUJ85_08195 [Elusimicrobia bacterium CG1_02_37_114]PIV52332.1 MAG: hypothetical protein COS17_09745 [Elusimicrobia bacterium CG02_land_8_20_14_3_00_37_13]PIZ12582.1 MAG: hypothetical protein COY53_09295 [Elusimicrobia bacterium CG_4_10_14_0_8_um_filter_37_32]
MIGKFKNVLCIYPYYYRNPYQVFPPLALEYIAGAVESLVDKVTVIDMRFERDITPYVKDADLVFTFGHYEDCAIFGQLKEDALNEIAKAIPENIPFITGGSCALDIKKTFEKCPRLNIVVRGNPEYPAREFIQKGSPENIVNLVYRRKDGEIVYNETKTHPVSNDILPARHLRKYSYKALGLECDIMKTSIGCNFKCSYCYQYGKGLDNKFLKWQGRTAESIFAELKKSPAVFVGFIDDDPLVDMDKIDRLCDMIIDSRMKKMFAGTSRLNYVLGREKTLKKMERAGFIGISWGVESPYDRTLNFYKKGISAKMNAEGLKAVGKTNMLIAASFVLGSPGETREDILYYLKYVHKHNIDSAVTNRLRVPKNSDLYEILYDPQTGKPKEGEQYKRIEGEELEKIKYAIKYGQRTPLRILLIFIKLARHKGLPLDPLYILANAVETIIRGTSLERFLPLKWKIRFFKWIFKSKTGRFFSKTVANLIYWPVKIVNRVCEQIDDNLKISVTVLPVLFGVFYRRVYMKQKLQHGWKET